MRFPRSKNRWSDFGTGIGSDQDHDGRPRTSSRSLPPTHNNACLAATWGEAAQARKLAKSPREREQTVSSGATSSPNSSDRLTSTLESVSPSSLTTSAKKVAFLT